MALSNMPWVKAILLITCRARLKVQVVENVENTSHCHQYQCNGDQQPGNPAACISHQPQCAGKGNDLQQYGQYQGNGCEHIRNINAPQRYYIPSLLLKPFLGNITGQFLSGPGIGLADAVF